MRACRMHVSRVLGPEFLTPPHEAVYSPCCVVFMKWRPPSLHATSARSSSFTRRQKVSQMPAMLWVLRAGAFICMYNVSLGRARRCLELSSTRAGGKATLQLFETSSLRSIQNPPAPLTCSDPDQYSCNVSLLITTLK